MQNRSTTKRFSTRPINENTTSYRKSRCHYGRLVAEALVSREEHDSRTGTGPRTGTYQGWLLPIMALSGETISAHMSAIGGTASSVLFSMLFRRLETVRPRYVSTSLSDNNSFASIAPRRRNKSIGSSV